MIKVSSDATLKKYGLSKEDWIALAEGQGWKCAICGVEPSTGRLCVDHQHGIKGWKKMKPEIKKTYVRGLLCWTCNRLIVGRGVTLKRLRSAVTYLENFETRLTSGQS